MLFIKIYKQLLNGVSMEFGTNIHGLQRINCNKFDTIDAIMRSKFKILVNALK